MKSLLSVSNISKKHGTNFLLSNISFEVQRLQKVAIAGETGSGKTTLMRILGGLGQADSGDVLFEDQRVKGILDKLMPGHPGIAYLSQHFELNNNYRVEEVLAYANKLTVAASEQLYEVCRIAHLLQRKTQTLSGGEKQRVALARLLTQTPRLLLLDEPYSNMDLIHKNQLKAVIRDVGERLGVTCMLISHDPNDMLPWADTIFIMKQGQIVQQGTPEELYSQPINEYAAGLFGKYTIPTPQLAVALHIPANITYLRPEDLRITEDGYKGTVTNIAFYGSHYEAEVLLAGQTVVLKTNDKTVVGDEVGVTYAEFGK